MNKITRINPFKALVIVLSFSILSACIPTAVGVATVTAIDLIKERRTVGTYVDDNLVEVSIRRELIIRGSLNGTHISVTALNGIALLTGEVSTQAQKSEAEQIASSYQGVDQVVNQLELVGNSSLTSRANDSLITAKVKTALLRERGIDASNIKVVTERGTVYLLGIVNAAEQDAAIQVAKTVSGVTRIVKVFMLPES